jgi:Family of unknown function (DUF5333)
MTRIVVLALMACFAVPAWAQDAKVPLTEEPRINQDLIAGAAGDLLRKTCPKVSARMFVVWDRLYQLRNYAVAQGYTEAEVKAFLKDPVQKARIKAAAADYLAEAGAVEGDVDSFCQTGRDEVAKETLLGSLIRVED